MNREPLEETGCSGLLIGCAVVARIGEKKSAFLLPGCVVLTLPLWGLQLKGK